MANNHIWRSVCMILLLNNLPSGECKKEKQLQLVQILFRHGDRTPTRNLSMLTNAKPVTPQDWDPTTKLGLNIGQLTPRGMEMHYVLGNQLNNHYKAYNLLTDDGCYNNGEVWVNSTWLDRTHQSALSQLAGWFSHCTAMQSSNLFNNVHWRPVPVRTIPAHLDTLLLPEDVCPKFRSLLGTHHTRPEWQAKLDQSVSTQVCKDLLNGRATCKTSEVIDEIEKKMKFQDCKSGKSLGLTLSNLWKVADPLYCRSQHNQSVPSWLTSDVNDWLMKVSAWQMYEMFDGETERRLTGGPLVKHMLSNIKEKLAFLPNPSQADQDCVVEWNKTTERKKLILFSAHDTTISALLKTLNISDFDWEVSPPYASSVMVELWSEDDGQNPELRLLYQANSDYLNQKNLNNSLKFTNLSINGCDHACALSKFESLVANVLPVDFDSECRISKTMVQTVSENSTVAVLGVALALALLIVCVCIVRYFRSKTTKKKKSTVLSRTLFNDHDETL